MTDFLIGYVVAAGVGLAGDPGLKASRQPAGGTLSVFETSIGAGPRGRPHRFRAAGPAARLLLISVPGGIEDYFREINAAAGDDERTRIGERHGIRVVPG